MSAVHEATLEDIKRLLGIDGDTEGESDVDATTVDAEDVRRRAWTAAEDAKICAMVAAVGKRWRAVAAELPFRTDDAVRQRWNRLHEYSVDATHTAVRERNQVGGRARLWDAGDEAQLVAAIATCDVASFAALCDRRGFQAVRNKHNRLVISRKMGASSDAWKRLVKLSGGMRSKHAL